MTSIKHVRLKWFCEQNSSRTFNCLQLNWLLLLFWSAFIRTYSFLPFLSFSARSSFHVTLAFDSIDRRVYDWNVSHSKIIFWHWWPFHSSNDSSFVLRLVLFSLISRMFELPVGFYWHRSSIYVEHWLALHHTFSLFCNNFTLSSGALPHIHQCLSFILNPNRSLQFHALCACIWVLCASFE